MEFTIVVPVLNEEQSVEKVARGCLAARETIADATDVDDVHVVVVSDGSTDRTVEIAQSIEGAHTVVFEHNRGYGAAIQAGWNERPADLVGFLDGDGTCDPLFFAKLIQRMEETKADVVLGSRMGADSRMPKLRRFGNWLFANLLGLLSRKAVTDSASGMRVIRRSSLSRMLPLPAGLHFTPAMSARAILGDMVVEEVPMPYAEREGRSKLSVVKDGIRFLKTILAAAMAIRPSRVTLPVAILLALLGVAIAVAPSMHYVQFQSLEEWMVYRFLFVGLLADVGVLLFCSTLVAEHIIAVGLLQYGDFRQKAPWWWRKAGLNAYLALSTVGLVVGAVLVYPGLLSYLETGTITAEQMHWSRVVIAAFCGLTFAQFLVTRLLVELLHGVDIRQTFVREP